MDAKALHLISHDGTVGLCQRKVETLGDGGSDGDSGGVLVLYLLSLFGFSAAADQIHDKAGRGRQEGEKTLGNHAAADSVGSLLIPVKFLGKPQTCGPSDMTRTGKPFSFSTPVVSPAAPATLVAAFPMTLRAPAFGLKAPTLR